VFDFLFEGRPVVYAVLAVVGVILLALWYRDRKPRWLIGLGVVAVLIGCYYLLDLLVETRREQINRKLQVMAAAIKRKDADAISQHLSDQFAWEGMDKKTFRMAVDAALKTGRVEELVLWEENPADERGNFVYRAKPKGSGVPDLDYRVRSEWVRDSDGQWRMKTFTVYNIVNNEKFELRNHLPQ
jgi:hypothetical protein